MHKCSNCNKVTIHQQEMKGTEGCIFRALAQSVQLQNISGVSVLSTVHGAQVRVLAARGWSPSGQPHLRLLIIKENALMICAGWMPLTACVQTGLFSVRRSFSKEGSRVQTDRLRRTLAQQ